MTKEDWLLVFHILKSAKSGSKKEFIWINPLTHIYLAGSMVHLVALYIIQGKNFQL